MKSFVIMFVLAFAIASADIVDVDDFDKQDKAETECNALFPGYKGKAYLFFSYHRSQVSTILPMPIVPTA